MVRTPTDAIRWPAFGSSKVTPARDALPHTRIPLLPCRVATPHAFCKAPGRAPRPDILSRAQRVAGQGSGPPPAYEPLAFVQGPGPSPCVRMSPSSCRVAALLAIRKAPGRAPRPDILSRAQRVAGQGSGPPPYIRTSPLSCRAASPRAVCKALGRAPRPDIRSRAQRVVGQRWGFARTRGLVVVT